MPAFARVLAIAAFFLTAACGAQQGQNFAIPKDEVYQRLRALDLGKRIDSATYMLDKHTTTSGKDGESVTWHYKGKDIMIAHLTAKDEANTNVRIELPSMTAEGRLMMRGLGEKLMEERIASHLDRRPFDDKKIMDTLYAGSMVPSSIQAAALDAQRQYAADRRSIADMDTYSSRSREDPYAARQQMHEASAPATDLSSYDR
jgi:hypothetical protein